MIAQMFRKLQDEEIIGVDVNPLWLHKTPLYTGELPFEFRETPKVIKCLNYPDSIDEKCSDVHP